MSKVTLQSEVVAATFRLRNSTQAKACGYRYHLSNGLIR